MTDTTNEQPDPEIDPVRADADLAPSMPGTADGAPTGGVELDEDEVAEAVVPDDKSIDGPQAGHA